MSGYMDELVNGVPTRRRPAPYRRPAPDALPGQPLRLRNAGGVGGDDPIPYDWATAGIADANAFRVGDGGPVHLPYWFHPNRVIGVCGVMGWPTEYEPGQLATWADAAISCPTCLERKPGR